MPYSIVHTSIARKLLLYDKNKIIFPKVSLKMLLKGENNDHYSVISFIGNISRSVRRAVKLS